jgi:tetratricopeptide (TPR) repeat protein
VALGRDGERHPLEQVVNEVKRTQGEVVIDLGQSQSTEGMQFIEAFLDSEPNRLGEDFRQALYDHTGGHPLFTVELLRAMQERGDLVQEDGVWLEGDSLAWDQLPARVEAVIEERIARLEDEIRELLTVASVEGNDFTAQVLARIQKVEERKLLRELTQELDKRHRLVREMGEVTEGRQILSKFQFAHHLFQRYLYNGISAAERRLLHGEITDVLEEIFAGEEERIAIQLAYHSQRANQPEKASRYLRMAGDQAKASYANQDAIRYYSELLELLPERNQERFEVLQARASVYDVIAKREMQLSDAEEMLEIARALQNDGLEIDAHLACAEVYLDGEHARAIEPMQNAMKLAREFDDPVREANVLYHMGWEAWIRGNYSESRDFGEQAVEHYRQTKNKAELARTLNDLSLPLGVLDEYDEAMDAAQEGVRISREIGDRRSEATGLRRIAIVHSHLGQYKQALPYAQQALELHREVGDWSEEANALNVLGLLYAWLERWEESEAMYKQSLQNAHDLRSTIAIQFATWNLITSCHWRQARYEDAVQLMDEEIQWAMKAEDGWLIGSLNHFKGWLLFELGDEAAALMGWKVALSQMERLAPNGPFHAAALAWIAYLHARLGELSGSEAEADAVMKIAEVQSNPADRVWPTVVIAKLALFLNQPELIGRSLSQVEEGLVLLEGSDEFDAKEEALNIGAQLRIATDDLEGAYEMTQELGKLLEFVPAHPAKQDYAYTIAQVHEALGQTDEADQYLRVACDWIHLVAEQTENEEWRRSWLEDARRNAEILRVAAERGIQ